MKSKKTDPRILLLASQVTGKRARAVLDLIIEKGVVTTKDLEEIGYIHPPRAVRDVRENGIPIDTVRIKGQDGKSIAAYTFGDPSKIENFKLGGRKVFPKTFKELLFELQVGKCAICNEEYDSKYLQVDHRIPYEVVGDIGDDLKADNFMLLCATCNKMKDRASQTLCAQTCFRSGDVSIMRSCFWASPENYTHICMEPIRRTDLVWKGKETEVFDHLNDLARRRNTTVQELIKKLLTEL